MTDDPGTYPTYCFSQEYRLVPDATVRTWAENEAHMDERMYEMLALRFGEPVVGMVEGLHYTFKPSNEVMGGECAVPRHNHDRPRSLLLHA